MVCVGASKTWALFELISEIDLVVFTEWMIDVRRLGLIFSTLVSVFDSCEIAGSDVIRQST